MPAFPPTRTRLIRLFALWFGLAALVSTTLAQQVSTRLLSRFLARGERTLLEIGISGARYPTAQPAIPEVPGVSIRSQGRANPRPLPNGQLEAVFEYVVSTYQVGNITIPPFEIRAAGSVLKSDPATFTVFDPMDLQRQEVVIGGYPVNYFALVRALKTNPYEGETVPVEVKLYLPENLLVRDWGIPDLERDGVTSWRFQPTYAVTSTSLLGSNYMAMAYPSTLTTTRAGTSALGPGKLRLITSDVLGYSRRDIETNLALPKLDLQVRPLPDGAPEGFENAIGNFRITAEPAGTEFQQGDPIPVRITVSGTGNLDNLRAPFPVSTDGWKAYDASLEQRGEERREHSGSISFNQFLRPLEPKAMLPAYRLVYFDPTSSEYKTVTTEPVPVKIRPSTAAPGTMSAPPPEAGKIPVEQMNDILSLLPPSPLVMKPAGNPPRWIWHVVPAAITAFLLALIVRRHWRTRSSKSADAATRSAEWKELERLRSTPDNRTFLLAAGRFIERWFGQSPPAEVSAILAKRDAVCFRLDPAAGETLDTAQRKTILHTMRKLLPALPAILLAFTALAGNLHAATPAAADERARAAYQQGNYEEAIQTWLGAGPYETLTADTLYHIGNACYRAGAIGQASLYYRRALLRDPGHGEALQNLRFLDRKNGAITIPRPTYQDHLVRMPLSAWSALAWAGGWMLLISLLTFPATRPGASARGWAIAGCTIAPLLAAAGLLASHHYPDDSRFAPLADQAVVIAGETIIHTDASRTSPEVITAPVGSLCEILHTSGKWSYVSFATKTRGWVLTSALEKLVPDGQPKPPEIRKPKADESSA